MRETLSLVANQAISLNAGAAGIYGQDSTDSWEGMATLTLDNLGIIYDCSQESEMQFKYRSGELILQPISMLLPQLTELELMQGGQINPRLRFLSRTGRQFQGVTRNGEHFSCKLFFNLLDSTRYGLISLIVRPAR